MPAKAATFTAHGHALAGDRHAVDRTYNQACELLEETDFDPESRWGAWLDESYVAAQRARSMSTCRDHGQATDLFDQAIASTPITLSRDRAVYLSRAARAYAAVGEPAKAAEVAAEALESPAKSGRVDHELRLLLSSVEQSGAPELTEVRDRAQLAGLFPADIKS